MQAWSRHFCAQNAPFLVRIDLVSGNRLKQIVIIAAAHLQDAWP